MPLDKESMKLRLKKRAELSKEVKEGKISKEEAKSEFKEHNKTLDTYGLCEPDVIANWDLDDVD